MLQYSDHILDIMRSKKMNKNQVDYEMLMIPHWSNYIRPSDVEYIRKVVTSVRYAGDLDRKLSIIKTVMEANGFKRFSGGTNRVIYRHTEDTRFLAKVAIDKVGMSDNPNEYMTQEYLKPFCAKMFQVTPCGTIGFAERVIPILRRGEFEVIAGDVFEILDSLLDKYILEDVGTDFFMNWGITPRIGPVLLDYPYIYELDHKKLICKKSLPDGSICNGFIDYDDGFNYLHCMRCGRKYEAVELKKYIEKNELVIQKGGNVPMKVTLKRGDEVIKTANESDVITSTKTTPTTRNTSFHPRLRKGDVLIKDPNPVEEAPVVKEPEPAVEIPAVEEINVVVEEAPVVKEPEPLTAKEGITFTKVDVDEVPAEDGEGEQIRPDDRDGLLEHPVYTQASPIEDDEDDEEFTPMNIAELVSDSAVGPVNTIIRQGTQYQPRDSVIINRFDDAPKSTIDVPNVKSMFINTPRRGEEGDK